MQRPGDDELARLGIQARYVDTSGHERCAPDQALARLAASLHGPEAGPEPVFVPAGTGRDWDATALVLEDGTDLGPVRAVPPDLPAGYHRLVGHDGRTVPLVVHPATCHRPDDLRGWGVSVQVPAIRSTRSWGIGDLSDVATLGAWAAGRGGRPFVLLSPLHAPNPTPQPQPSPYYASSRCFRSPLLIDVDRVPGAARPDVAGLAARARQLLTDRRIDRARAWELKRAALEMLFPGDPPTADDDPVAAAWAAFCAAVEVHGPAWRTWPAGLRQPTGAGWPGFTAAHSGRVAFHRWLQHVVDTQLSRVAGTVPLVHDLAVGTDPDGFDAWHWQDLFVLDGTRIGAPPDQFNTQGQDWGLPPMDPWRLRTGGYEPVVRMLRSAMSHGAGLRIDHVMGLFRLFWIPAGHGPADGAYVRQRADELLALVALESDRAGTWVVGEDLGTVEPGVREAMAERHLLGYRVLTIEDYAWNTLPVDSLASVATHDTPTVAGLWTGSDLADQQAIGTQPNVDDTRQARARLRDRLGLADDAPSPDVAVAVHGALASTPCRLVAAQYDDMALVAERANMPGTVDEWPNWSLATPRPLEDVLAEPLAHAIADELAGPPGAEPR